jgi:hypothetical protein
MMHLFQRLVLLNSHICLKSGIFAWVSDVNAF